MVNPPKETKIWANNKTATFLNIFSPPYSVKYHRSRTYFTIEEPKMKGASDGRLAHLHFSRRL
jgi:hypothetical protein